jgi:ketosteroid isomerase-like protein
MALTDQDRIDIIDLISPHGRLVDTDEANPVGHHVTDIVITELDDGSVRVRSEGIGVMADGRAGSAVHHDVLTRHPDGWKISHRTVSARRVPPGKDDTGARAVLERYRRAAVEQSVEDLERLYAVDAVHEFPFTRPGLPSRLEGREEIVTWIAGTWQASALKYEHYRTIAIHDTTDPHTIVVEQEAVGTSTTTGDFTLPNLFVLTVRDGRIIRLRDYVNILAAAAAIGGDI